MSSGLYSSNTREIEMFASKWFERLHSSTSKSRDEGGGKKIEKGSSMLVWTGSTENPYPYRDNLDTLRSSAIPVRKRLKARRQAG